MSHTLPELPYSNDALEPHISSETLSFHYGKHHKAYLDKLNGLIDGTDDAKKSLEDLIKTAKGGIFNSAAQVWNHTFYWNSLSPKGGGAPTGKVKEGIEKKWGSFEKFKEELSTAAATKFGSGWTWLVTDGKGGLDIVNTDDAGNPLTDGKTPVLTLDVWEHAYYIDYRNARPKYIEAFWHLVNWDFANEQL